MDKLKELFEFKVGYKDAEVSFEIGHAWFVVAIAIIWWGLQ